VNQRLPPQLFASILLALAAAPAPAHSGGDDAKALISHLEKGDDRKIKEALEGLKELGGRGVEGLLVASRHKKTWVRATAWRWLGELGADARPALEPLCAALATEPKPDWASSGELSFSLSMQLQMIGAVITGGPFEPSKAGSKEEAAEQDPLIERLAALGALAKIGATDPTALLPLIEKAEVALDRGYLDLHAGFAKAVTGADKAQGLAVAAAGLKHASPRVQAASLLACCVLEKRATDLGPDIATLLDSDDAGVRGLAAEALSRVRHPCTDLRPRLVELLRDDSAFVRCGAAQSVVLGLDDPEAAFDALLKNLADPSTFARMSAVSLLGTMSKKPPFGRSPSKEFRDKAAVKPLTAALGDPVAEVRRRAASTLGSYGSLAKPALPALNRAMKDPRQDVKAAAKEAVDAIEKP